MAAVVVGVGLIVVATFGLGSSSSTPMIVVNGIVVVTNHSAVYPDDPSVTQGQQFGTGGFSIGKGCHSLAGYQDLVGGAPVVLADRSGTSLSTVHLRSGVYDAQADCVFGFSAEVPKGQGGYQVTVAKRDPVTFSEAEIVNPQLILN